MSAVVVISLIAVIISLLALLFTGGNFLLNLLDHIQKDKK